MPREFEVVVHNRLKYVNAFLVQLQQRTPHVHREIELGYVLKGSLAVQTMNRVTRLQPGDLYMVDRLEAHEFLSEGEGALLIAIQLSPKMLSGFLPPDTHLKYEGEENLRLQLAQEPEVYRLLCGACIELAWCYLRQSPSYELRCFQLTAELLTLLHTRLPWQTLAAEDYANIKQRANRLQSITDYIDQNCQRKLLLAEIAQREDLSLTYLSHFFKDNLGMTFQDYLNRKRLEYACQLLFESDRKILDIALSSGFSDVRYFNEAFRARYGCTPKEWRKGGAVESARLQELNHSTQRICSEQEALQILEPMHRGVREEIKQYTLQQLMS